MGATSWRRRRTGKEVWLGTLLVALTTVAPRPALLVHSEGYVPAVSEGRAYWSPSERTRSPLARASGEFNPPEHEKLAIGPLRLRGAGRRRGSSAGTEPADGIESAGSVAPAESAASARSSPRRDACTSRREEAGERSSERSTRGVGVKLSEEELEAVDRAARARHEAAMAAMKARGGPASSWEEARVAAALASPSAASGGSGMAASRPLDVDNIIAERARGGSTTPAPNDPETPSARLAALRDAVRASPRSGGGAGSSSRAATPSSRRGRARGAAGRGRPRRRRRAPAGGSVGIRG